VERPADSPSEPAAPVAVQPRGAGLVLAAPAKINLNLLVAPARLDGYHPIDSYAARITLYDTVDLQPRRDSEIRLECVTAGCGPPQANLAVRAARLMATDTGAGVDIRLTKGIPPGAGLGGGSSDAAAVLRGLNQLWNMGRSRQELAVLAAALGSDVPLFLGPPAVRMTGCGERIEPVEVWPFWAVLLLPALPVATAEVYRQFDRRPAPAARQVEASLLGRPPSTWRGAMVNHLREPAERVCPQLAAWREKLTRLSLPVCLSGSGSSMFVLCDDRAEAHSVLGRLPPDVRKSCLVVRLNPW
jgi:4-diphosphocytidyl-2-C-methyl-D-erythritol kinase